jgi:hypothetical protein
VNFSAFSSLRLCSVSVAALCVAMVGCGANIASNGSLGGGQLRGSVHGGQQPVSGASIQLYAAANTGYGATALPLLTSPVTSDTNGNFSITGDYTCPSSTSQLYLVARGGNPGLAPGTNNAAIALMTALGTCSLHGSQLTLDPNAFIGVNEVTTVASVYALAAFIGADAAHVGTSSTNAVGLSNAFQLVNNLVNTTTGTALATTPSGNGTVPQAAINTLANIIASCVNSTGIGGACATLASLTTPVGGTPPTDTIIGTLNVARNPAHNASALFALEPPSPPFQPTLSPAPNDWVLSVNYSGGGLSGTSMAIDASGDVWLTTSVSGGPFSITKLSSNGTVLSGNGYTGGGLSSPTGIAIDPTGNAWIASSGNVVKFSSGGTLLSGANGFTGGGLSNPQGIAVDGQGNAWVPDQGSNSVIKLGNSGTILSGAAGFQTGAASFPLGVGIDTAGDAWVGNGVAQTVTEFANDGTMISVSGGYPVTGNFSPQTVAFDSNGNAWTNTILTNSVNLNNVAKLAPNGTQLSPPGGYANCVAPGLVGGLNTTCLWWSPDAFALDGAGNVWGEFAFEQQVNGRVPNPMFSSAVSEISNTGTILSGATGLTGGTALGKLGPSAPIIQAISVDGSGNVWVLLGGSIAEFVGAATPVVTPFSVGVKNGTLGLRP